MSVRSPNQSRNLCPVDARHQYSSCVSYIIIKKKKNSVHEKEAVRDDLLKPRVSYRSH